MFKKLFIATLMLLCSFVLLVSAGDIQQVHGAEGLNPVFLAGEPYEGVIVDVDSTNTWVMIAIPELNKIERFHATIEFVPYMYPLGKGDFVVVDTYFRQWYVIRSYEGELEATKNYWYGEGCHECYENGFYDGYHYALGEFN